MALLDPEAVAATPGEPKGPGAEAGTVARHIARAAARLFATRGYDATSVREIVEAAGVTKPTLYYHFRSKEGLAHALVNDPMSRLVAGMRSRLDAESDPVAALASLLQAKLDFCFEDPDRARFFYALFFGPLATGLSADVARFAEQMDALQDEGIARVLRAGVVPAERADFFRDALNGLCVVHTVDYLYRDRPITPDLARSLVDDLLEGCRNRVARVPEPGPAPAPPAGRKERRRP